MSTKRYAVIGHPIGHTMSPFINRRLFALKGIDAQYEALDIAPGELEAKFCELNRLDGYNVTIPHKQSILPLLSETDRRSGLYHSVNTVKNSGGAHSQGFTTDADGFLLALRHAGFPMRGRVVILGCGGAARTMAYETVSAGCSVVLAVRPSSLSNAAKLSGELRGSLHSGETQTCRIDRLVGHIDLLINATPVGMYPHADECPVDEKILKNTDYVFDAVYNPMETKLMKAAKACGCKVLSGVSMLVWQAVASHAIWDGSQYDPKEIFALCEETEKELSRLFPEA